MSDTYEPTDPWHHAIAAGRDYLTPEDIEDAREAGADEAALHKVVLTALGRRQCEDPSLCAYVAVHGQR